MFVWGKKKTKGAVQNCPLEKGTIWVSVKYAGTGAGVLGSDVNVAGPTPGQDTIGPPTLVKFEGRDPGAYKVQVTLPGDKVATHRIVPFTPDISVGRGGVAVAAVEVFTIGALNVRVVDDANPPKLIQGVRISASGPESLVHASQSGTHGFGSIRSGVYSVTATPDRGDLYSPATASVSGINVPVGGTGQAQLQLRLVNIVTPVVDLVPAPQPRKENEIWFVPAPHVNDAQTAGFTEQPIEIVFKYIESNTAKPFAGGGTISWDPGVRLFSDAQCTTELTAPSHSVHVSNGQLQAPHRLWAKGSAAATANVHLALDEVSQASGITVRPKVQRPLVINPIVIVEPKIEVEYKVVVFDRDLAQHQTAAGEPAPDLLRPPPTRIEVSVKQSADAPLYTGDGTLSAPNCDVFLDAACTQPLARKLTNAELRASPAMSLYLKWKTRGVFDCTLTLDPSNDPRVLAIGPAKEPMGVVELQLEVYEHKTPVNVSATTYPLTGYCADLEPENLIPDQVIVSDADKVKVGRTLHEQKDKNHGRAKIVLKLTAAEWPAGTDDYDIVLEQSVSGLRVYDAETKGARQTLPLKTKVSVLKAGDKTFWLEGTKASEMIRGTRLSLGLDRAAGGLAKEPKPHGDWARFTVVKIESVTVEYTQVGQPVRWNASKHRWYINYEAGDAGRKVKIRAKLSKPIKDVKLHFMLTPDKDNLKKKNWGVDLPGTWTWDAVTTDVKQKDKANATDLLHVFEVTDATGKADKELTLSRFGGDMFRPGVYIDQDPHLAAYVHGHDTLEKRKPALCDHRIKVWRKFAYQKVKVEGRSYPSTDTAEGVYGRIRAEMIERPAHSLTRAQVDGFLQKALLPEYMFKAKGGTGLALNVSDANMPQFFAGIGAEGEHPIKIPIITCDFNWANERDSAVVIGLGNLQASAFPLAVDTDVHVCDPPLQGGALLVSGDWIAAEWDATLNGGAGDWGNVRQGVLAAADVSIDRKRTNINQIRISVPAGAGAVTAATVITIDNLVVQGAPDDYLGGYDIDGNKRIVALFDPKEKRDYQNTVVHEIGHAFHQTNNAAPAGGVPVNANFIQDPTGGHCTYGANKCVMYTSGPIPGSLNKYCPDCHPHMLVQDMQSLS
jgi:hypothetical protein